MAKQLEKEIQLTICDYLAFKSKKDGFIFWRQNTAPIFDKGFYRPMPKYSLTGMPDIVVVKDGKYIGLEVKRKGGKQSDNQILFQKWLEKAGGEYHVVESLDDVIALGL